MEEALHGVRGIIKDACTNQPIVAELFITAHDFDSSQVYSALPLGDYFRPIMAGTYDLTFSAPGYQNKIINNVVIVHIILSSTFNWVPSITIGNTST